MTYGDYPDLIGKTLDSLRDRFNARVKDIRIGLNGVSDDSFERVMSWCEQFRLCPVYVYQEVDNQNVGKYPLMRRMFYERPAPVHESDAVMWFDDDTFLDGWVKDKWWDSVAKASEGVTLMGLKHSINCRGNQAKGIAEQLWYTGSEVKRRHKMQFMTGGWWLADSNFLSRWDYPFTAIYHNGGDSILGELCRQQSATMFDFKSGAQCHAECCYKNKNRRGVVHVNEGGRKGRRGIGKKVADEVYPWQFYGEAEESIQHHLFDIRMYSFNGVC
jgi:hypothetical protein|tara:strand:- start:9928 stop:10746 length:819 start_codon:yes stop_codon:yes gene_type:complete